MATNHAERRQRMIPGAAIVVAVVIFITCAVVFPWAFESERNPPPFGVQLFLGLLVASAMAIYVLLAGYVFRDARRRGMRHVLWTFIVVLVPNGIGFILYFLLRQPTLGLCPRCHTTLKADFNYCPLCNYQLKPVCASCGKTADPGSVYCPYCGNAFTGPGLKPGEVRPATGA